MTLGGTAALSGGVLDAQSVTIWLGKAFKRGLFSALWLCGYFFPQTLLPHKSLFSFVGRFGSCCLAAVARCLLQLWRHSFAVFPFCDDDVTIACPSLPRWSGAKIQTSHVGFSIQNKITCKSFSNPLGWIWVDLLNAIVCALTDSFSPWQIVYVVTQCSRWQNDATTFDREIFQNGQKEKNNGRKVSQRIYCLVLLLSSSTFFILIHGVFWDNLGPKDRGDNDLTII